MLSQPALNATLNAACAAFLLTGYWLIRRRQVAAHRFCMCTAFGLSVAFLVSYVIYHLRVGSVRFGGEGWIRPVYYTILFSHVVLAVAILPLSLVTLSRALREQFDRHRRIARWTLPLWLYVSVTGVIVYWLLYHAYAAPAVPVGKLTSWKVQQLDVADSSTVQLSNFRTFQHDP